jgi:hypothetical protein
MTKLLQSPETFLIENCAESPSDYTITLRIFCSLPHRKDSFWLDELLKLLLPKSVDYKHNARSRTMLPAMLDYLLAGSWRFSLDEGWLRLASAVEHSFINNPIPSYG